MPTAQNEPVLIAQNAKTGTLNDLWFFLCQTAIILANKAVMAAPKEYEVFIGEPFEEVSSFRGLVLRHELIRGDIYGSLFHLTVHGKVVLHTQLNVLQCITDLIFQCFPGCIIQKIQNNQVT